MNQPDFFCQSGYSREKPDILFPVSLLAGRRREKKSPVASGLLMGFKSETAVIWYDRCPCWLSFINEQPQSLTLLPPWRLTLRHHWAL